MLYCTGMMFFVLPQTSSKRLLRGKWKRELKVYTYIMYMYMHIHTCITLTYVVLKSSDIHTVYIIPTCVYTYALE